MFLIKNWKFNGCFKVRTVHCLNHRTIIRNHLIQFSRCSETRCTFRQQTPGNDRCQVRKSCGKSFCFAARPAHQTRKLPRMRKSRRPPAEKRLSVRPSIRQWVGWLRCRVINCRRIFTWTPKSVIFIIFLTNFLRRLYSKNIIVDPFNASPTLAEGSVRTYVEAGAPLATYTATHLVKSYPGAFRQNSSNMSPVPSWLCGIQAAAMKSTDFTVFLVNLLLFSVCKRRRRRWTLPRRCLSLTEVSVMC